jgi:hypothetical protein
VAGQRDARGHRVHREGGQRQVLGHEGVDLGLRPDPLRRRGAAGLWSLALRPLMGGPLTLMRGSLTRWAFGRQGTGCTHVPSSRLPVAHTAPPLGTNPPELEGRVRASA